MKCRHDGGLYDRLPVRGLVEHGCHEEHKTDLHKLRRLYCKSTEGEGKLCAVGSISDDADHSQKYQPEYSIDPWERHKLPYPVDDKRDDPGDHRCRRHDHELSHSPVRVQPCEDNKSRRQKRTHIVDEQSGTVPVKQSRKVKVQQEKYHLRTVKG